jgi:N-acetyl-gamma-glutamyl-phosphate reductase
MINVGIVGGAGYTGGELLRILINHPEVTINFVHSKSNAGNPVHKVHQDLIGFTDLIFSDSLNKNIDVLMMCLGHGDAKNFLDKHPAFYEVKIVDLSTDFRHKRVDHDFVYGLPELNKEEIIGAKHIANPGCFATCIQLGVLPLAEHNLLKGELHVTAVTGSTGAGQKPTPTSHFSWRSNNISVYKAFEHQHLTEINQSLTQLQEDFGQVINFVPFRGDFTRGIIASIYIDTDRSLEECEAIYKEFYSEDPFTHIVKENPNVKQVVNTNNGLIYLQKFGNKLHVISIIDNLVKGASGQAVQNLNLLFNLDEMTGLRLKPSAF